MKIGRIQVPVDERGRIWMHYTDDVPSRYIPAWRILEPDFDKSLVDGHILFFGNSFTISSANPAVHTPSYGGARGIPELVRQVAIAAGHDAPPLQITDDRTIRDRDTVLALNETGTAEEQIR